MKPGGQYKHVTIKLTPEGARQALRALGDVLELQSLSSPLVYWPEIGPRVSGQLRLLALLLERSLDEIDQLAPHWPTLSGPVHKVYPRKFPK